MFMNGSYARVWEVKRYESGAVSIRISTSSKDQTGEYQQDFSSWVRVGKNTTCINELNKDMTIKLVKVGVKNTYKKEEGAEKGYTVWEPWIFDAVIEKKGETGNEPATTSTSTSGEGEVITPMGNVFAAVPDMMEAELPFD